MSGHGLAHILRTVQHYLPPLETIGVDYVDDIDELEFEGEIN